MIAETALAAVDDAEARIVACMEEAHDALEYARSLYEVRDIHSKLAGVIEWLKRQTHLGIEIVNEANYLKIEAEARLGEFLQEPGAVKGDGRPQKPSQAGTVSPPTHRELGIPTSQAQRYRQVASVPAEVRQKLADEATRAGREFTRSSVIKAAKLRERPRESAPPSLPEGVFDVIVADPPWRYDFMRVDAWAVENHYETMTVEELGALSVEGVPVTAKFAKDAVLFLWVPAPKMSDALMLMFLWGWEYKTCAVWRKNEPGAGMGYYWHIDHELLLLGTRGKMGPPPPELRESSLIAEQKRRHSQKPDAARAMIERMYPNGRRLELFAREAAPGWSAWGSALGERAE